MQESNTAEETSVEPRILYPAKVSFKLEGLIKILPDIQPKTLMKDSAQERDKPRSPCKRSGCDGLSTHLKRYCQIDQRYTRKFEGEIL